MVMAASLKNALNSHWIERAGKSYIGSRFQVTRPAEKCDRSCGLRIREKWQAPSVRLSPASLLWAHAFSFIPAWRWRSVDFAHGWRHVRGSLLSLSHL